MKFLLGAVAIAIGAWIFYSIRFSRLAAGAIGVMLVYGTLTLWSFSRE